MKKHIQLKNQKVIYSLRRSKRAKRMRLAIYCDGSFVVTVPRGLNLLRINDYILQKAEWVIEKLTIMEEKSKSRIFFGTSRKDYQRLKVRALEIAGVKVEKFNEVYGYKYNKITIRNQKTRWGSCSKKGNLNYNYKIALMPPELADYIVVHELCHLEEFNHSKNFWRLVEKTIPDFRERVRKIKHF